MNKLTLTNEQRKLLITIALYHQMADGADFVLGRSSDRAELVYPANSVQCDRPDEDFYQLNRANFITLARNGNGELCGHLTARGMQAAFGAPTGNSVYAALPGKLIPKGTRAYEVMNETNAWVTEHLAFFHAELLENMPAESASAQEFVDYSLKAVAGTFDIWIRGFLKGAVMTEDATEAFGELLNEIEKLLLAQFSNARGTYINPLTWPSEVKRRLQARKQHWIGHRLRTVREHHEQATATVPKSDPRKESESSRIKPASWEEIQLCFISDHEVKITVAESVQIFSYKQLKGFEDRRSGKPNQAWAIVRVFGSLPDRVLKDSARSGTKWIAIQKTIERASKALRVHFAMTDDPFPYIRGSGYQSRPKITVESDPHLD